MFTVRLVQWLGWVFETQKRKKKNVAGSLTKNQEEEETKRRICIDSRRLGVLFCLFFCCNLPWSKVMAFCIPHAGSSKPDIHRLNLPVGPRRTLERTALLLQISNVQIHSDTGWTASDMVKAKSSWEDPRANRGLISNLPRPRINKTKQHKHPTRSGEDREITLQTPRTSCSFIVGTC